MLGGTFFSAISQILLKQSANKDYSNPLKEYLNWRVITAYGLFFGILLLNTWCYTQVDTLRPCNRYGSLCICFDSFQSDPEGAYHPGKDHWKSDHNSWNHCVYLIAQSGQNRLIEFLLSGGFV